MVLVAFCRLLLLLLHLSLQTCKWLVKELCALLYQCCEVDILRIFFEGGRGQWRKALSEKHPKLHIWDNVSGTQPTG